jgi:hypothetical protein
MTTADEGPAVTPGPPDATPKLNAALAKVQAEMPELAKGNTAEAGTYSYKYADLADCTKAIIKLLGRHGLAFSAKPTVRPDGKFVLAYALKHESGERDEGEYPLSLSGTPQALGGLITYARRYSLCAITGLAPGGDDDDAAAAQAEASGGRYAGRDDSWRDSPVVNRRGEVVAVASAPGANGAQPKPDRPPAAEPETDVDWMAHLVDDLIPLSTTREQLTKLWADVAAHKAAGTCTAEHADQIGAVIKSRNDELTGAPA